MNGRFAYNQILVTGKLSSGESVDVTRMVERTLSADLADVSRSGLVRPRRDGKAVLVVKLAGHSTSVPVTVSGFSTPMHVDFIRDVAPVLSRLGL